MLASSQAAVEMRKPQRMKRGIARMLMEEIR